MLQNYDVVVVGGGLGGVVAAVAAARRGARTLIMEKGICFGGTATVSEVCEIDGAFTRDGRCVLPKIGLEIVERAESKGAAKRYGYVPMSSNPDTGCDRIRFNPEEMKLVLDEIVKESGADIMFMSSPKGIKQTQSGIDIEIDTPYSEMAVTAKILVDSTGNSEAVFRMDPNATIKTKPEELQGVTMIYRLGNVDTERFMTNIEPAKLSKIIEDGMKCGALKYKILATCPLPGMTEISVSTTRAADVDPEDPVSLTRGILETREQITKSIPYLKSLAGLENAYLSSIAGSLGIRERRKIRGVIELSGDDVVAAKRFDDAVAFGCYPVDIHRADAEHAVQFTDIQGDGVYSIPYRCLISPDYANIIIGCKAICADNKAFAALRTMPSVMGIGNAAGIAASIAAKDNEDLRTLKAVKIQEQIRTEYHDCAPWL
ncbi:MAG: FAD-dependent oxidoreductase [Synergistaceae bacterium]|nr:FAD-dependent oxidoreductase [Synergistaceae bacterium]